MKVIIRGSADDDIDRIFAWIAKDNVRAATEMVGRIRDSIDRLELDALACMGRTGLIEGTRETRRAAIHYCVHGGRKPKRNRGAFDFHSAQKRTRWE
jgi:plasmid stabilization system protein ParE